MRVLLTGGAGYAGSRVAAHLLCEGMEVTVLDTLLFGGEGLLGLRDHPNFRFMRADIRDASALRAAMRGAEAVVHLAALVGEPACQVDAEATLAINRNSAQQLACIAESLNIPRLLFVSTCSNYGVLSPDVLADESTPLHPVSLYAESKVEAERAVLCAANENTSACVLRFATLCGLSPRMRFGLLVNDLARSAALGEPISLYAPDAWRPFLHVRDAARVVLHALQAPVEAIRCQTFNVVGDNYRKRDLADLARKHFPEAVITTTDAQPDKRDYRVSGERVGQRLGFLPAHTIEEAFLEVSAAVQEGLFSDPHTAVYEALPDRARLAMPHPLL